jgi:3-hydroxyisobutyrate dehydrogenase-like beta-hydroxyacid dehydrogenase
VAPQVAFDVLTGSLLDGNVRKTYGGKIVENRYSPPGMTTPLAVKDLRLARIRMSSSKPTVEQRAGS